MNVNAALKALREGAHTGRLAKLAEKGIVARISGDKVRLKNHVAMKELSSAERFFYPFRFTFNGVLTPDNGGAILIGKFEVPWPVRFFFTIWLGGLMLGMLVAMLILVEEIIEKEGNSGLVGVFAFLGLMSIGICYAKFGQRIWRQSNEAISNFMESTLDAEQDI